MIATSVLMILPGRSDAAPCYPSHCYSEIRTSPTYAVGNSAITLRTSQMDPMGYYDGARMQHEGWTNFPDGRWVESGTTTGTIGYGTGSGASWTGTPVYFLAWASNPTNPAESATFTEYDFPGGPGLNVFYTTEHRSTGTGSWCIYFGGAVLNCPAPSSPFPAYSYRVEAGLEVASGNPTHVPTSGTTFIETSVGPPGYGYIPSSYVGATQGNQWCYQQPVPGYSTNSLNFGTGGPPCASGQSSRAAQATPPPFEVSRALTPSPFAGFKRSARTFLSADELRKVVDGVEANPSVRGRVSSAVVRTASMKEASEAISPEAPVTRDPADQERDAWLASDVAVVSLRGTFELLNAPVPAGAAAPRGSVLNVVVDRRTGRTNAVRLDGQESERVAKLSAASRLR
ncbi:hypothetical protein AB0L40_05670 [Patulibacter sp. NPDC049589]|uniref:hypothetical protein n=1 Tax=Patulibacter sp. NPDC049589 TaxID=3154731 RepID=UPI003436F95A